MEKIELKIVGISSGHTTTSYTLILEENSGVRKLPIIIGAFEAQAIAIEIEKIVPVRPMTHDLFKAMAMGFGITIKEVIIHRLHDGVFYSVVVCELDGHTEEIDARTSDAIALAIRFKSPIYTYESIMKEAGIVFSETEGEAPSPAEEAVPSASQNPIKKNRPKGDLTQFSNVELDAMLTEALENEDYVFAAKIRDEMHKREEGI